MYHFALPQNKSILQLGFLLKVIKLVAYSVKSVSFYCFSSKEHVQLGNTQYTPGVLGIHSGSWGARVSFAPTLECIYPILPFVLPVTCNYRYAVLLPSVKMNHHKMTTWFQLHSCLVWGNRSDLLMYTRLLARVGSTLQQIREVLRDLVWYLSGCSDTSHATQRKQTIFHLVLPIGMATLPTLQL